MTRRAAIITLLLLGVATPAAANTAVERVHNMIVFQNAQAGFDATVSEALAACFTSVMSEVEAETILGAEPGAAQQVAVRMMQNYDDAIACVGSVME